MSHLSYMSTKLPLSKPSSVTVAEIAQGQLLFSEWPACLQAGIQQTDYNHASNKDRRLCPCAYSLPSPKPCNQRAPKGLVTLSLSRSTRAGKATTSII